MFDIGFSELLLFGVIALVVLGPEKLPEAARTAGKWYAKLRRAVVTLQNEIEAELDLAETRQKMQEELTKIKQAEADMKKQMAELKGSMKEFEEAQNNSIKATPAVATTTENELDNQDYAYAHDNQTDSKSETPINHEVKPHASLSQQTDNHTATIAPATRPWQNMWFLLGDYDKVRRLPPPPQMPNYRADALLNASPEPTRTQPAKSVDDNRDTSVKVGS